MNKSPEVLHFVTTNPNKLREARDILGINIISSEIDLVEPQASLEEIVLYKAHQAFDRLQVPVIVDDVGLYLDAFLQTPGPLVKHFMPDGSPELLLKMLKRQTNRLAIVRCGIGYKDSEREFVLVGEIKCTIPQIARGQGWGFDPIIIPDGFTQTWAEIGEEKKNQISHRHAALVLLKEKLTLRT